MALKEMVNIPGLFNAIDDDKRVIADGERGVVKIMREKSRVWVKR